MGSWNSFKAWKKIYIWANLIFVEEKTEDSMKLLTFKPQEAIHSIIDFVCKLPNLFHKKKEWWMEIGY